jgi:sterol 3beta-glucosyltransferase
MFIIVIYAVRQGIIMRISVLALGSRGDVQPYVALGKGLQDSGHQVRIVTFEIFRAMVENQGLDFLPVKGDAQALMNSTAGVQMMESGRNPFKLMRNIMDTFGNLIDDYIESFSADALHDSEAIINQLPASLFGYDLAEKLNIPHIIASVIPLQPTGAFPLSLLATKSLGAVFNRATYQFAEQLAWQPFRAGVNRFRKRLGLKPAPLMGHFSTIRKRHDITINGFSRHVVPPPADWGDHVHTTGYWILNESQWTPPRELLNFMEAGQPPVFIGFGSMPMRDPALTTQHILDAVRLSGQRAVISSGWANLSGKTTGDNIFWLDYAPYDWLFPRIAAIVHHGGSGTTALGLRSGVPSIVVPFGADQPYWGSRVMALGVGPAPIPFKTLTAEKLVAALQAMVNDREMRQRAAQLSEKLCAEDGLSTAVEIINKRLGM